MKLKQIFKRLDYLPIAFIFLILWLPLGLTIFTLTGKREKSWIKSLEGPSLMGVQAKTGVKAIFTWQNLMSGSFQKQAEDWINMRIPLRTLAIRATNQFYYSAFAKSYMQNKQIVIGKSGYMYEASYISKYCSDVGTETWKVRQPTASGREVEKWITDLREVSNFFHQRGQAFIYLITPSKAAYFPEKIPQRFTCSPAIPRLEYQMAIAALRDSGLTYVDGSKIVMDGKGKYPVDLFPRGGSHWNLLGATLVTRELLAKISQVSGQTLRPLEFSYIVEPQPQGSDMELLSLANLWGSASDDRYPVPKMSFKKSARSPVRLAIVGSSFMYKIIEVLDNAGTFCKIDYYYYFETRHERFPTVGGCPVKGVEQPDSHQELLSAPVVILEENEANLRSHHLELLRKVIVKKNN